MSATDPPKAIGSLAKKQPEVTRQGTQKLKFVPTLPARRKKEEVKVEQPPSSVNVADNEHAGVAKGRGRGMPRKSAEMTASGPFAMGPALSSHSLKQSLALQATSSASASPKNAVGSTTVSPSKVSGPERRSHCPASDDEEFFSEPDDGVELIDLHSVRKLDWIAPESLRRGWEGEKGIRGEEYRAEMDTSSLGGAGDELNNVSEHFLRPSLSVDRRAQSFFTFQFPAPFPTFSSMSEHNVTAKGTFTPDIKPSTAAASDSRAKIEDPHAVGTQETIDGVIGQLELYRDGVVRIRMTNGILLDVEQATQLAFPQQAVILGRERHRMFALGKIDRRYVVLPDVDVLTAMDVIHEGPTPVTDCGEGLITMDNFL